MGSTDTEVETKVPILGDLPLLGRLLLLPELDLVPPLLEDGDAGDPGPGVLVAPHERLAAQVAAPHRLVVQHGVEVSQELDQNVLIGLRLVHSVRHLL